ncbi:hypothetical protein NBT05_15675 [Aquimarina sp. ERC-38]|uniref:hypothetical protein n=1 Tax=Aquimarina sp. ERC-38 TaxID=2949996 RepID=UPI0022450D77|nr:hypothetical protein [Aquimarina sp. ERC-38]UZO80383.1 hypothetical protein NBT05_15675 [Aquimarina sp. ERC-38]
MKNILIFLNVILLFLIFGCKGDDDQNQVDTKEYTIRTDSQIKIPSQNSDSFIATIESGNKLVFEYTFDSPSDPQIADSGFSEEIIFEIESDMEEFSLNNESLEDINAFYRATCFCSNIQSVRITEGTISGKKLNATSWEIQIDVKINLDITNIDSTLIERNISNIFMQN